MPSMTLDVAYDSNEDFPALMNTIEKEYAVKASVVKWVGPGGGWPEIKFEGEVSNLKRLYEDKFDGGEPFEDTTLDD